LPSYRYLGDIFRLITAVNDTIGGSKIAVSIEVAIIRPESTNLAYSFLALPLFSSLEQGFTLCLDTLPIDYPSLLFLVLVCLILVCTFWWKTPGYWPLSGQ